MIPLPVSPTIDTRNELTEEPIKPWYRYGWPWFLISFPFISMVLGGVMLYLALTTNNSLVVDDYYQQGKAINVRIERDRASALLGMAATLSSSTEGLIVDLSQTPPVVPSSLQEDAGNALSAFTPSETLSVRWIHVTQAEKDGSAEFISIGGERYVASGASLPTGGKYRIHLQPQGDSLWRLVSSVVGFEPNETVLIHAPRLDEVFNKAVFE